LNIFSKDNDVFIIDAGNSNYISCQNLKLKDKQRFINPGSQGDMGFAIPASVGVGLADSNCNPIVIVGDGSFNTNLQELGSIKANKIKSKIIILNNDGYLSIRTTQKKIYNEIYGVSSSTGIFFPDVQKISEAYGINYFCIENNFQLHKAIEEFLHSSEAIVFEIKCKIDQEIIPYISTKEDTIGNKIQCGLEDMYPFMDVEELNKEMII
jgi:acetolactate synthase-1/2/3 large subunit